MGSLVCVPIMVQDEASATADAQSAHAEGADLVEFRVDEVFDGDPDSPVVAELARLISNCPLPVIFTCRSASEGGHYLGDESARIALYQRLAHPSGKGLHAPRYLDVEFAAFASQWRDHATGGGGSSREGDPSLILSMHDFQKRPADLSRRLLAMTQEPSAVVVKVAYRARSLRDNLELFELLRHQHKPTIALAMGEFGLASRVLAPKFDGLLTFASLRAAGATAPGQPTIRELLSLYRFRSIARSTRVYGIVGWPVSHSLSPLVHNDAFEACAHDGVYLPLPIPAPDGAAPDDAYLIFRATMLELVHDPNLDLSGTSVTLPHKEHLVRLAREERWELDEPSHAIGAGNTLVIERDGPRVARVRVLNTDVQGLLDPLSQAAGLLSGELAAVIGSGGVARAAVYGLVSAGARITIYARDANKAKRLAHEFSVIAPGSSVAGEGLDALGRARDRVFVHCTPLGMRSGPSPTGSCFPDESLRAIKSRVGSPVVLDTVYNPVRTPLLIAAERAGWHIIDGVSMFVRQAALQSEAWTGCAFSPARAEQLVRAALAL